MVDHRPGAANLRTPTLIIRKRPQCGEEVGIFSCDVAVKCSKCGFVVYNNITSLRPVVQPYKRMSRSGSSKKTDAADHEVKF
jgi:hypothetical protein